MADKLPPRLRGSPEPTEVILENEPQAPLSPVPADTVQDDTRHRLRYRNPTLSRYLTVSSIERLANVEDLLPAPELAEDWKIPAIYRDLPGYPPGRKVKLYFDSDVKCWDKITEWKSANPAKTRDDAMKVFCPLYHHADAIITLLWGTPHYDYIMVYENDDEHQHIRDQYERSLLQAGLILEREPSVESPKKVFTKVIAPFWVLAREAQRQRLMLPNKKLEKNNTTDSIRSKMRMRIRGSRSLLMLEKIDADHYTSAFRIEELARFEGGDIKGLGLPTVMRSFFIDSHRSLLTYHLIEHPSRSLEARELYYADHHDALEEDMQYDDIYELLEEDIYTEIYNTHQQKDDPITKEETLHAKLLRTWVRRHTRVQPLDDVRAYFGEKIAMFFAFFGLFNAMLIIATILGAITIAFGLSGRMRSGGHGESSAPHDSVSLNTSAHAVIDSVRHAFAPIMLLRRQHEETGADPSGGIPSNNTNTHIGDGSTAEAGGGEHATFWDGLFDNAASPFFAFAVSVWATIFTSLWRRKEKVLAFKWGTEGFEEEEATRPAYYGTCMRINPVTHKEERYFPRRQRWIRQTVALLVACVWIAISFATTVGEIYLEAYLARRHWSHFAQAVIVACLSLVSILTVRRVYHISAHWLNDWENYRTNTDWEDALIYKIFVFDFINFYSHAFYFAFLKKNFGQAVFGEGAGCTAAECSTALQIELFVIFTGATVVDRFREIVLPWLKVTLKKFSKDVKHSREERALVRESTFEMGETSQSIVEDAEPKSPDEVAHRGRREAHYRDYHLNEFEGIYDNYAERCMQFGFIVLFAAVFPIAPIFALLNNAFELRGTAFNLLEAYRRGVPLQAQDIGSWEFCFNFIARTCVSTNAFLIAFLSDDFYQRYLASLGDTEQYVARFAFVIVFHYAVYIVSVALLKMMWKEPRAIQLARRRRAYLERTGATEDPEEFASHRTHPFTLGHPCGMTPPSSDIDMDGTEGESNSRTPSKRGYGEISEDVTPVNGSKRSKVCRSSAREPYDENSEEEEDNSSEGGEEQSLPNARSQNASISNNQNKDVAAGTIESVKLFNFMCHKSVRIPFGPKINFIIGQNGSGKSAVLTALTVCLGGTPRATGRATAVKDLLREGTNNGSVTVRIRNKGTEAYKPHEYGDFIEIERRINREGQNSYKISSADGRTISTKKEELVEICNHMAISPDNPMAVLTQDTAKSFLASSDAHEKFKLFMAGTQLAQLGQDHNYLSDQLALINSTILRKEEALPDMKKSVLEIQKKHQNLKDAEKVEQRIEYVKKEVAWSQIAEIEAATSTKKQELEQQQRKLSELTVQLEEARAIAERQQQELMAFDTDVNGMNESAAPVRARLQQLKDDKAIRRRQIDELIQDERNIDQQKNTAESIRQDLERKIHEERRKLEQDLRALRESKAAQLEAAEARTHDLSRQVTECKQARDDVESESNRLQELMREREGAIQGPMQDISRLANDIKDLHQQKNNRLFAYGRQMPEVLRVIDQFHEQGRWKGRKPIGPFGIHVKLADQRFLRVIESVLGNTLGAFGVEYHEDLLLLQQVLDRYNIRQSPILKYMSRPIDYSRGLPDSCYTTILNVLEIDNDIVRDQLIINEGIEQRVLVATRAEGDRITAGGFPPNVSGVYTIDLYSMGSRGGGLSTQTMREPQGMPRLGGDLDAIISEKQQLLNERQEQKRGLEQARSEVKRQLDELARQRQAARTRLQTLEREVRNSENVINQINETMREAEPINLAELEDAKMASAYPNHDTAWTSLNILQGQDREIMDFERHLEILEGQKQELYAALQPFEEQIKQANRELKVLGETFEGKKTLMENAAQRLIKYKSDLAHFEQHVEQAQHKAEELHRASERAVEELHYYTQKAEEFSERVPVNKPAKHYEDELSRLYAQLRAQGRENGDIEQVSAELQEKLTAYNTAKMEIRDAKSYKEALTHALHERRIIYEDFKNSIAARARAHFSSLMSKRGYNGQLKLDYAQRTLNIVVKTEDHGQETGSSRRAKEKDPKALSGGEKSFSTVCLLLKTPALAPFISIETE
ncbi:Structural maintenance of chromosomes protein 6 [Rhizophlyctis rosea]|nr:Structural maintenance of chromosomes protein 6 [Rhizophlyctis rosea]